MEIIENVIQHLPRFSTVLVACDSERYARDLVGRLNKRDISILGPVYSAEHALIFASHTTADLAVVQVGTAKMDDGRALARDLERTWGIPSLLVQGPA